MTPADMSWHGVLIKETIMNDLVTLKELALYLRVSDSSVVRLRKDTDQPFPKPLNMGGRILFRREEINAWLAER